MEMPPLPDRGEMSPPADSGEAAESLINEHDENMRSRRRAFREALPRPRLSHVHLEGAKLLPSRYDLLKELPRRSVVCEVGVADGSFSAQILKKCEPAKLHLVDAWEARRYRDAHEKVRERFHAELASGCICLHVGQSTLRLREFPDYYFDWIYIDTVHDYQTTAKELSLALKKVKRGGIIAGHDHTAGNVVTPVCYGVVPAVQEFCVAHRWKYLYLTCESHCYTSFALRAIDVRGGLNEPHDRSHTTDG